MFFLSSSIFDSRAFSIMDEIILTFGNACIHRILSITKNNEGCICYILAIRDLYGGLYLCLSETLSLVIGYLLCFLPFSNIYSYNVK